MESLAFNGHLTPYSNRMLTALSKRLNKPKAEVIEQALRDLEDRIFWAEVQQAYAKGESAGLKRERELWDTTAVDGLHPASW